MNKMDTEIMNLSNDRVQLASNFLSLFFKSGLALGGVVFISCCLKIGYFPQDASFGDSVIFIFLAITFSLLYSFFVYCLTNLGIAARPFWYALLKIGTLVITGFNKITGKNVQPFSFTIEKADTPVYVAAAFGLFFVVLLSHFTLKILLPLICCSWLCALIWSLSLEKYRDATMLQQKDDLASEDRKKLKELKKTQLFLLFFIFLIPLTMGGVTGKFLDGAMRFANLRTDSVAVHIKAPYTTFMAENGLSGKASNFGNDYLEYNDVTVLLQSIGKNVVIEKNNGKSDITLPIPADNIFIVKAKKK